MYEYLKNIIEDTYRTSVEQIETLRSTALSGLPNNASSETVMAYVVKVNRDFDELLAERKTQYEEELKELESFK